MAIVGNLKSPEWVLRRPAFDGAEGGANFFRRHPKESRQGLFAFAGSGPEPKDTGEGVWDRFISRYLEHRRQHP
jgi:hypothetical protein